MWFICKKALKCFKNKEKLLGYKKVGMQKERVIYVMFFAS